MSVPWTDPQFWVVTLVVAAAVVGMVRSLRRASGSGGQQEDPGCSHCALAPGNQGRHEQRGEGTEAEQSKAHSTARAS